MCQYYLLYFSFGKRRVIKYEINYFNSKYKYDKEVPKASYIFVLWMSMYLIDYSLLCMFTNVCIVLFSSCTFFPFAFNAMSSFVNQ